MTNRINGWQRLWIGMATEAAQTRKVFIERFGYWLITSAGLYFLGHGIAWSRRGISNDISHLR